MKFRATTKQRFEIRKSQYATRALREELEKRKAYHVLVIAKLISDEEDIARSNRLGSRFYKKVYTTEPMSKAKIKKALAVKRRNN